MKKLFLTFFVLLISSNQVLASGCLIKDKSAPVLLEYIKNNRLVIKNITWELSKNNNTNSSSKTVSWNIWKEYENIKSSWLKIYNEIFNFDSYYSYFNYFAIFPIKNEVPLEVKRDYNILLNEWNWIKSYLESILKSWKWDIIINNACKWVNNCNIWNDLAAWFVVWKLIANNDAIMDLYRNTVIWEIYKNPTEITLVSNNFSLEIEKYYNIASFSKCSEEEWWFFNRIYTKWILIINENIKLWKDWIKKWQEAIDLLLWNDTTNEKYVDLEKRLLKEELSKQWIYWDSQTNMLEALDKYNIEWWFSENNNFVVNTFNNTRTKLEKKLKEFKEEVIWDFFKKKNTENININNILDAQKNSINTNEIKETIDRAFLEMSNLEWISEMNTTNIRNRIINVHIDLSNSINTLELTCPKAVQVCNEQDYGNWNCWKCN